MANLPSDLNCKDVGLYFSVALRYAAEKATVKGALSVLRGFDERLTGVVTLTHAQDVSILKLRWLVLVSILSDYKQRAIQRKVRQMLEELGTVEEEISDALTQFVLQTSPDDFIEDEHINGKKFLEQFEPLLPLLGGIQSDIVAFLLKAYQRAWHEVLYIEIPAEIVPFLEKMANLFEEGDVTAALDTVLAEMLRWHDKVLAFL